MMKRVDKRREQPRSSSGGFLPYPWKSGEQENAEPGGQQWRRSTQTQGHTGSGKRIKVELKATVRS